MGIKEEAEKEFDRENPIQRGAMNNRLRDRRKQSFLEGAKWALNYRGDELSKKLAKELSDGK